jgi:hypothetical protein
MLKLHVAPINSYILTEYIGGGNLLSSCRHSAPKPGLLKMGAVSYLLTSPVELALQAYTHQITLHETHCM